MINHTGNPINFILTLKEGDAKMISSLVNDSKSLGEDDLDSKIRGLAQHFGNREEQEQISTDFLSLLSTLHCISHKESELREKTGIIAAKCGLNLNHYDDEMAFLTEDLLILQEGGEMSDKRRFITALTSNLEKLVHDIPDVADRLEFFRKIAVQEYIFAFELISNFEKLGLEEATVSDRFAFIKEIYVTQTCSDALIENFNKFALEDIEVSERLSFIIEMTANCSFAQNTAYEYFDNLGFVEDLKKCESMEAFFTLFDEIAAVNGLKMKLGANFDQFRYIADLKNCETPETRLALCRKIIAASEYGSYVLARHFAKLGLIEDLKNCENSDQRLALFKEIAETSEILRIQLSRHFDKLGFIEDFQGCGNIDNRLALFKECEAIGNFTFGGLIKSFDTLGLEEATVADRLAICHAAVTQDEYQVENILIENIEKFRLEEATIADRLALCKTIASQGEEPAKTLIESIDKFDLEDAAITDRLALYKIVAFQGGWAAHKLVDSLRNFGLKEAKQSEQFTLCKILAAQSASLAGGLSDVNNLTALGETYQPMIELLAPYSKLDPTDLYFQETRRFVHCSQRGVLLDLLATIKKGVVPSEYDLNKFEKLIKDSPIKPFYDNIKGVENEMIRNHFLQLAIYTAGVFYDLSPERIEAIKDSGILNDIFGYHLPLSRFAFIRQVSYLEDADLKNMTVEAGTKSWSKITWVLLSRLKQIGFSDEGMKTILDRVNGLRGFRDGKRFEHLVQLLLQIIELGPYSPKEIQLLEKAVTDIVSQQASRSQIMKLISRDLQTLTNIQAIFGNLTLFACLESEQNLHAFFLDKFKTLFPVNMDDGLGLSDWYEKTFGSFRDPVALYTYLRSVKQLPSNERDDVKKTLDDYVNAVLNDKFPAARYETTHNPHLEFLFEKRPGLKEQWLNAEKEQDVKIVGSEKPVQMNYKEYLTQKILTDKQLDPDDFPHLRDYLQGKEVEFEVEDEPNARFQSLAIGLCKGVIQPQDFQKQVRQLGLELGEFENDLSGLTPMKSLGDYKISESDDPCDLLMIGTEIQKSCQRIDGDSNLNKCLPSYLMNGEIRPIVVKSGGKLVARSLLRLMWDEKNQTPVLLQERLYSNVADESVKVAINSWAVEKAKKMGIPLVSKEIGSGEAYDGTVEFKGGYAPFVYSDASAGVIKGPFETKECHTLYAPAA